MYILGVSSYYHDSAACLIKNDQIIAAAQEERFSRKKHDASFPLNAIKYCLQEAEIDASEIDQVVFYEKPFLKFERIFETFLSSAPKGFFVFLKSMPLWIKDKLFQKKVILKELKENLGSDISWNEKLLFSEHHLSHAASAFFASPFQSAAVLTLDAVGEWATTSLSVGEGSSLKILKEIHFPHSLGLLYSSFTYYLGFKVNSGEYKLMGLAPYGIPKYEKIIKDKLISIAEDGSFQLNMKYFGFTTGLTMTNRKFNKLFGGPPRKSESNITQREMDLAASIQKVTEEIFLKIAKDIAKNTGEENLCLAGGVALNCVANGALFREKIFKNIWIQPAAGDAGGAIGAALSALYLHNKFERKVSLGIDKMNGAFLGPEFSENEIKNVLEECGANFKIFSESELIEEVAKNLINQKAIGWMQGRMEFGPRALGGRSIIADPSSPVMQKILNLKVKYRESFRPFAPSVLSEEISEWFEDDVDSPYMLFVSKIKKNKRYEGSKNEKELFGIERINSIRSCIPAVTHIDFSARLQTVHQNTNPKFYALISKFKEMSGYPMLVNTSFNVRGEPIVCSPLDAFKCFMGTELDVLVIGNFLLYKSDQDEGLKINYKEAYEMD